MPKRSIYKKPKPLKEGIIVDYGYSHLGGFGLHIYLVQNGKIVKHLLQKDS